MAVSRLLKKEVVWRFIEFATGLYAVLLGVYPNIYGLLFIIGVLLSILSVVLIYKKGLAHMFKPGIVGLSFSLIILYGYILYRVVGASIFSNELVVLFILIIGVILSAFSMVYELLS